jgi:hypothetical protein
MLIYLLRQIAQTAMPPRVGIKYWPSTMMSSSRFIVDNIEVSGMPAQIVMSNLVSIKRLLALDRVVMMKPI